jgi:hypothetical protein
MNIRTTAPNLNAHIKTHKEDQPICPVINNIKAPSYKAAKFLNKKLWHLICLTNTYTTKNSLELALKMKNIQINENNRIITLDIKDLCVNSPTKNILRITEFWLNKGNQDRITIHQTPYLLETILKQNYFQHNNQFYQPNKGIIMGSPISGMLAEIYLQYLEEAYIKHCLENKEITYINIFDQNKISEHTIHSFMNNVDEHLEFKMSTEENRITNYLDLSINRNTNNVDLHIYRKPNYIDITIHFSSNHPYGHKLAAFNYYINRMITMPISEQAIKQEWNKILIMAHNNGFPTHLIHGMKKQLMARKEGKTQTKVDQQHNRKWVTFIFRSLSIYKITNLFKRTNLRISFRPTNTIYQQLSNKTKNPNPTGIYQLKYNTCTQAYVGQSGRPITTRHREHLHYIRNNNPTSAYATHILDNRHEFGPAEETLKLLKPCSKGNRMDC